jgi:hypothetical protein
MNLPLTTATLTFDSCISDLLGRFPAHLFVWLPAFSAHLMFYAGQCCRASCEMKHPAAYHLLPPPPHVPQHTAPGEYQQLSVLHTVKTLRQFHQ